VWAAKEAYDCTARETAGLFVKEPRAVLGHSRLVRYEGDSGGGAKSLIRCSGYLAPDLQGDRAFIFDRSLHLADPRFSSRIHTSDASFGL
jgi:hypothetical protein